MQVRRIEEEGPRDEIQTNPSARGKVVDNIHTHTQHTLISQQLVFRVHLMDVFFFSHEVFQKSMWTG